MDNVKIKEIAITDKKGKKTSKKYYALVVKDDEGERQLLADRFDTKEDAQTRLDGLKSAK